MKEFTEEMRLKLYEANESVRGDLNRYYLYHGELSAQRDNGTWFFIGWGIPSRAGTIKKIRGKLFVYYDDTMSKHRCALSDKAIELLGLES